MFDVIRNNIEYLDSLYRVFNLKGLAVTILFFLGYLDHLCSIGLKVPFYIAATTSWKTTMSPVKN